MHLHSQTVQAIAEEYATRRRHRKVRLSWRKSTGSRRSLGWIPFKKTAIQVAHGQVKFAGQWLSSAGERAIHAKIANRRRDSLHQLSTRLVRAYDTIYVGHVSAAALAKTPHAKSVLDASWSAFRTMLRYKWQP